MSDDHLDRSADDQISPCRPRPNRRRRRRRHPASAVARTHSHSTSPPVPHRHPPRHQQRNDDVRARDDTTYRGHGADRRARPRLVRRCLRLGGVIPILQAAGLNVMAPANPLRGLSADTAYIASVVSQIDGPVLLGAHSYGGAVITNAASQVDNVVGLVYVSAFIPDEGETIGDLAAGHRQPPRPGAAARPVPHRRRRTRRRVLHRPGVVPRGVLCRPPG